MTSTPSSGGGGFDAVTLTDASGNTVDLDRVSRPSWVVMVRIR